jgi:hypothetical protein
MHADFLLDPPLVRCTDTQPGQPNAHTQGHAEDVACRCLVLDSAAQSADESLQLDAQVVTF